MKQSLLPLIAGCLLFAGIAAPATQTKKPMTHPATYISVSIGRPVSTVYQFASNPENLPKWAAGLGTSVKKEGDAWVTDSPMGKVKVKFAGRNDFGVLDHEVTLESGVKVYNPMRVQPNGDGSEVVFTLYRLENRSDKEFREDADRVHQDLLRLKEIFEKQ